MIEKEDKNKKKIKKKLLNNKFKIKQKLKMKKDKFNQRQEY